MSCEIIWWNPKIPEQCFIGSKVYASHLNLIQEEGGGQQKRPLGLPLWEIQTEEINIHTILKGDGGTKRIPSLGTYSACIPLLLAGYSALSTQPDDVVAELGPFTGFSSRYIVSGMAKNSHASNSYIAFDIFEGIDNYNAISRMSPWTTQDKKHKFTKNNTDFLFVWETAVKDIYPEAQGRPGWSSKKTINHETLGNKTVSMISIDSAKSPSNFVGQQEGLLPIKAGTIWFLMDFGSVHSQSIWLYGCMRDFLMPVYAHWEQWAFVVKKDITALASPQLKNCFQDIRSNIPLSLIPLKRQLETDFKHLLSFDNQEGT